MDQTMLGPLPMEPSPVVGSRGQNFFQWIGLRENFNRKAPYLMGKSMVSGSKFPLNQSNHFYHSWGEVIKTMVIYHLSYFWTLIMVRKTTCDSWEKIKKYQYLAIPNWIIATCLEHASSTKNCFLGTL